LIYLEANWRQSVAFTFQFSVWMAASYFYLPGVWMAYFSQIIWWTAGNGGHDWCC